jgi:hypothetical protein
VDIDKLRVDPGSKFKLRKRDAGDTLGISKSHALNAMPHHFEKLAALHDLLYAEHNRALLIVLQGMDAGRQGRHHQARDVGRQSSGLHGDFLQRAQRRGT